MKRFFLLLLIVIANVSCTKEVDIEEPLESKGPTENNNPVIVNKDTIVSLQKDFDAICVLENGFRYTLGDKDSEIKKDTSKVLISLKYNAKVVTINDYLSKTDKRHSAPNVFDNLLIKLGKQKGEYIGWGVDNFIIPSPYYVINDGYNILFHEFLFKSGKNSPFTDTSMDSARKVKFGDKNSFIIVDRKTFGSNYKDFISDKDEDGTYEYNSGYKVFFNEPGHLICEFATSTGVNSNGNVLGSHKYVLKFKILNKIP